MWNYIAKGMVVGLITGMPLGPIGAMCLKATLSKGYLYGLISGLGASAADCVLAIFAVVGTSLVSSFVLANKIYFDFFGGLILIIIGAFMLLEKEKKAVKKVEIDISNLLKVFFSTFLVALINPSTIITFFAVFTSPIFSNVKFDFYRKALLVIGVFLGSMLWWFALIIAAAIFKERMDLQRIKVVNKIISAMLILSGVYIFLTASSVNQYIEPTNLQKRLFRMFFNIKERIPKYK